MLSQCFLKKCVAGWQQSESTARKGNAKATARNTAMDQIILRSVKAEHQSSLVREDKAEQRIDGLNKQTSVPKQVNRTCKLPLAHLFKFSFRDDRGRWRVWATGAATRACFLLAASHV